VMIFILIQGVLLENLTKIRQDRVEDKIVQFSKEKDGRIFFSEQTALSFVCRGRIKPLDVKFNLQTLTLVTTKYQFKQIRHSWYRTQANLQIKSGIANPVILHTTTCFLVRNRAWIIGSNYPRKALFDFYAKQVPSFSYFPDSRSRLKKLIDLFLAIFPKFSYLPFLGCCYSNGRIRHYFKSANKDRKPHNP
jgi:hypothetical protein